MTIKELKAKLDAETVTDLSAANKVLSEMMTEEPAEEPKDEPAEEPEEPVEEPAEEPKEEPAEPTEEPEGHTPEEAVALSVVTDYIQTLKTDLEDTKKKLAEAEAKLSAKVKEEADFFKMFANLSASTADEKDEKPVVTHQIGMTNGIGEL